MPTPKLTQDIVTLIRHVMEGCTEEESQAKALVAEARRPGSLLAPFFEMDPGEAAYQYHLIQAHQLMIRASVWIQSEGGGRIAVPVFIKTTNEHPGRTHREIVMRDPRMQQDLEERFFDDMLRLCTRYARYGMPQVNQWIRQTCKLLKLQEPVLFDGRTAQAG